MNGLFSGGVTLSNKLEDLHRDIVFPVQPHNVVPPVLEPLGDECSRGAMLTLRRSEDNFGFGISHERDVGGIDDFQLHHVPVNEFVPFKHLETFDVSFDSLHETEFFPLMLEIALPCPLNVFQFGGKGW